jgi:cytochrome c-type biogenesis protein CcmH/NrfG
MSPLWHIGFHTNASLLLHIGTTMGILGIFSLFLFCILLLKDWSKHPLPLLQAGGVIFISFLAPPTLTLVLILIPLIIATDTHNLREIKLSGAKRYGIAGGILLFILLSSYGLLRWYTGESLLYQASASAKIGNGTGTFLLLEKAMKTNPTNPVFHSALSETSLLLAQTLVHNAPMGNDGKPILMNDDKVLLKNLSERSVQEAKLAIADAPSNVDMWVNLAQVYQGLIGITADAEVWAVAAYEKAMTLDPVNPILPLHLGGLYMTINQFEHAEDAYRRATILKPNFRDAWYNLSQVYQKTGDWDNALDALQQLKSLIAKGSADEIMIDQEIKKVSSPHPTSL